MKCLIKIVSRKRPDLVFPEAHSLLPAAKKSFLLRINYCFLVLVFVIALPGCKKYLNIVPDDVATIDNAFTLIQDAIKYLGTC